MRKVHVLMLLCMLAATASLAGCTGRGAAQASGQNSGQANVSTIPNRQCNSALVVNSDFLATNEGLAGAGGPDLPGAGGATRNCRRN